MKKDVLINIRGVYRFDNEESDVVELFTTGEFYKKGGDYYISYKESEATGFEGSRTTLRVEKERQVELRRSGSANSHLVIQSGARHQCYYDMGFGDMMVGVNGRSIRSTLTDEGGSLEFKYTLDINSLLASENEMVIMVKESKPHGM